MIPTLITADFQADWSNLDLCESSWDEILEICKKRKIERIVIAGDLKQVYNPVDVRVVKWWMRAITQARNLGIEVICLLGNHDRLGQYQDADNWFPVIRKAGAICVDSTQLRDGLALLPFHSNKKKLKESAKWLQDQVEDDDTVLIFHEDLSGCKYNYGGGESKNGVEKDWLYGDRYRYCVGGHVHMPQRMGRNIYYCGSPFTQDWGEANQRKGYVVVGSDGLEFVLSKAPGWFDPTWKGFYEPKTWRGTRVRVHIKCRSSVDYVRETQRIGKEARERYKGADITVSATFRETENEKVGIAVTDSDEDKIREYVKLTCPEHIYEEKVVKYLVSQLERIQGRWIRTGTSVNFLSATGKNFLSFRELDVDWAKKGITLVEGKNQDRMGRSNGAGKTSVLQTIPVSLFGRTFKGQKHDSWARRNAQGVASITLALKDSRNRLIKIRRTRKPTGLRLWVNEKEQSSGMKPQDKDGTQGLIEKITGFTWQTLANAVYIDQEVASAFIAGTKRERTSLLSRFQNLERFENALERVRGTKAKEKVWGDEVSKEISVTDETIRGCEKQLSVLIEESKKRVREAGRVLRIKEKEKDRSRVILDPRIRSLKKELGELEDCYERLKDKAEKDEWAVSIWKQTMERGKKDRERLLGLEGKSICPTCMTTLDPKSIAKLLQKLNLDLMKVTDSYSTAKAFYSKSLLKMSLAESDYEEKQREVSKAVDEWTQVKREFEFVEKAYYELKEREHTETDARKEAKEELDLAVDKRKELEQSYKQHLEQLEFYEYCEKALSRDGIPAFLNALLCGPLNQAAEYYAGLFGDGAIRVRFELDDGEFVPKVLNITGGEDIEDQSTGEKALAGLIASFALREIAPKCNLLILDEPGEGLDPSTAKQFARSLRTLTEKFDSIFVTTHNVHIQSELSDQQVWAVVKQNGISQLKEDV